MTNVKIDTKIEDLKCRVLLSLIIAIELEFKFRDRSKAKFKFNFPTANNANS